MTTADKTVQTPAAVTAEKPSGRRVGTFTLGIMLVLGGGAMLASLFRPSLRMDWVLRLTPCILISLGVEVLLAARGGRKVRYDWLGMFLCFILTVFSLALYGAAWWMLEGPGIPVYNGSWRGDADGLAIHYSYFNDVRSHWLELAAGDKLDIKCDNQSGWLNVEIYSTEDGETVFNQDLTKENGVQVEAPATGGYYIELWGHEASGRASFTRIPGPNAAELDQPPEETEDLPEETGGEALPLPEGMEPQDLPEEYTDPGEVDPPEETPPEAMAPAA